MDTIDDYIAAAAPEARPILKKIRRIMRKAAPRAEEIISYRMPAFRGNGVLVYFAAFKKHVGLFPPIRGDKALEKALAPYRGPKGNLQFPFDQPIPYDLIERIATLRVAQDSEKPARKMRKAK
ncbi:MAG: DUF1801 domain-containing protein [Alphaproteobacteria bacterium]